MPTVVHFDIGADDVERAKKFYEELFEWKINAVPVEGKEEMYNLIETKALDGSKGVDGGMAKSRNGKNQITNFIGVDSVDNYLKKVEKFGGKVVEGKMAVPEFGYMAVCLDTEGNTFGLWEDDKNAS